MRRALIYVGFGALTLISAYLGIAIAMLMINGSLEELSGLLQYTLTSPLLVLAHLVCAALNSILLVRGVDI